MGFTAIPGGDIWLQIGTTQTPTSGSSVSFTSIPPVKKLRILVNSVTQTASSRLVLVLNNDTGAKYTYAWNGVVAQITASSSNLGEIRLGRAGGTNIICDIEFDYANQACPKLIQGMADNKAANGDTMNQIWGNYNSTDSINRIDVVSSTSTFAAANTGTIAIYGAF
jgi:hypothetical protein